MARLKVSQKTVDELKAMGMAKAIEHASSSGASPEFKLAASRFYPKLKAQFNRTEGPAVTKSLPASPRKKGLAEAAEKAAGGQAGATKAKYVQAPPGYKPPVRKLKNKPAGRETAI